MPSCPPGPCAATPRPSTTSPRRAVAPPRTARTTRGSQTATATGSATRWTIDRRRRRLLDARRHRAGRLRCDARDRMEAEQAQHRVALPQSKRARQHRQDQDPRAAQEARLAQVRGRRTERQLSDVADADAGQGHDGDRLAAGEDRSVRGGAVQRRAGSVLRLQGPRPHADLQVGAVGAAWLRAGGPCYSACHDRRGADRVRPQSADRRARRRVGRRDGTDRADARFPAGVARRPRGVLPRRGDLPLPCRSGFADRMRHPPSARQRGVAPGGNFRAAREGPSEPARHDHRGDHGARRARADGRRPRCGGRHAGARHQAGDGRVPAPYSRAAASVVARADARLLVNRVVAHGTVRFYFDYISSNAYLAWTQLPKLCDRYAFTIEPVPVLFAGLLEAHGQLGPAEIPAKALWTAKNNVRKATLLDVPLNPPAFHPFNPLLALRVSSPPLDAAARHALIGALFDAVWVH